MKRRKPKVPEVKCPACNGTGFEAAKQPMKPNRKIYPPRASNVVGKVGLKVPRAT